MAIETKYVCDSCGHTQDHHEQMWKVGVTARAQKSGNVTEYRSSFGDTKVEALWCRSCMEKAQLVPFVKDKEPDPVPAPPTIEKLIEDIVEDFLSSMDPEGR